MLTSMSSAQAHKLDEHDPVADLVRITKAVGDPLRANILQSLSDDAFGVLELCEIFDMAQPALSHHLKILFEAGLVTRRKEGTTVFYQRVAHPDPAFIEAIYHELDQSEPAARIQKRLTRIHEARSQRSRDFFASNADALAQQQELICAPEIYQDAVIEIIQHAHPLRRKHALEVGPGNGLILRSLAEHFTHVTGMDSSPQILKRTACDLEDTTIRLVEQDFLSASTSGRYDLILAAMVVHHLPSPARFFSQARSLLHDRGLIILVELCAHDQEWVQSACGDLWLGFKEEQIENWAQRAGLRIAEQQFLAQLNGFRVQIVSMVTHPD